MTKPANQKPLEPTTITRLLRGIELERQKLVKLHNKRMADNDQKRRDLQARCEHNWQRDIDPADGRSSYECVVCRLISWSKPQ